MPEAFLGGDKSFKGTLKLEFFGAALILELMALFLGGEHGASLTLWCFYVLSEYWRAPHVDQILHVRKVLMVLANPQPLVQHLQYQQDSC